MSYSKIKRIKVVNFRNIGSVDIDMTGAPIVALTGSNESGKSSVIRAFGAAADNLWRVKQSKYIRTGTDGFAVLLELDDGTKVIRKKTSSMNGYTLVLPDGTRRDATKIDIDVPDYIEAVMGMTRDPETRASLQFRTYDDPLLFVSTTDGQNYKVFHNGINNLDVRGATIKAKADSTELLAKAEKQRNDIEVYNRQLSELPLIATEYLSVVLSALMRASDVSENLDAALTALEQFKECDGVAVLQKLNECKTINADTMKLFTAAFRNYFTQQDLAVVSCDSIETVDTMKISTFTRACGFLSDIREIASKEVPKAVRCVSDELLQMFEKAKEVKAALTEASESYDRLIAGIEKVTGAIKASGMRVVNCDKCGNGIVVPVGDME